MTPTVCFPISEAVERRYGKPLSYLDEMVNVIEARLAWAAVAISTPMIVYALYVIFETSRRAGG